MEFDRLYFSVGSLVPEIWSDPGRLKIGTFPTENLFQNLPFLHNCYLSWKGGKWVNSSPVILQASGTGLLNIVQLG